MPSITRSAAAKDDPKAPSPRQHDAATAAGTRRAVFAERRAAAGQPAVVDTLSAATAVASGPATRSPLSAVRRRSVVSAVPVGVDHAPLRSPSSIVVPPESPPGVLESAAYLQQARSSIASTQSGSTSSDERRPSSFVGATGPRPSLSQTVQSLLPAPFRSSRSSSHSSDPLLASQPSDLLRPSFFALGLGAPDPGSKSPNPNGICSSVAVEALEFVSLNPGGGRRAQRHLRAGVLLFLVVVAVLTVTGHLSLPAASVAVRGRGAARDELVLEREELAAVRARRAKDLWGSPEHEVVVAAEGPAKGHAHESTIIFMHGLKQVKNDAFMPAYLHKRFPNTRWVVPLAEKRHVGVFDANETAWFNIDAFPYEYDRDQDRDGMFATVRRINRAVVRERARLIRARRRQARGDGASSAANEEDERREGHEDDEEVGTRAEREWGSRRIILAGFSQGAVMSLLVGLTHPERLGGVIVFSGFLPLRDEMAKLMYDLDRRDLPVWWGHGGKDDFLTFSDALASLALLSPSAVPPKLNSSVPSTALAHTHPARRLNLTNVTFRWWDGIAHTFCLPELVEVDAWVRGVLPPSSSSRADEPLASIGA
ncbi:uncharacterized protein RHOBADRAFT_51053 [Rhodotorula graminis WP1]|uniref:Acyl-protein thioesterase 1 n=1 Tax=Rhodotorula graminis (strain WP1) TaxID=578459 RepID=A0A194SDR5_RHOGW|nr:uncharacterized protein RHOBADRAFT_51053 [Rhodotorula graminis WP1]KPV78605.1 hypothetical protein RHOBADRAFT_51053 [Rhodotorula graminis WP1]